MAPHPARDGGKGGYDTSDVWKPPKKVPPPRPNLGPKLAHELAMQRNVGVPPAHPSAWLPSPMDSALLRVWRELPELQKHAPLGAIVATNAPLPDASQGAEALREAAATELARCRRAFLEGAPLPRALAPGGEPFPEHAVHTALLVDATAGEDGILGTHEATAERAHLAEGAFTAAADGFAGDLADARRRRRGPPPPPASALDASAMSPAYSRMFRSGAIAEAVLRALSLPPEDLCAPSMCNGVRVSTSAGTPRAGAAPAADFGIRRCGDRLSSLAAGPATARNRTSPFSDPPSTLEWPAAEFVTRHVTATNTGAAPVLIVAVVCVPEMRDAFRVRCDHRALARHSGDRDPPGRGGAEGSGAGDDGSGPVALFPGASYEVSVDFRAEGRRNTPGQCAQWVLFATVECPVGWKTGDGFPSRRAASRAPSRARLDEGEGDDDDDDVDVDPRDVRVAGCRAVAVVLRGSRERRQEVASMMLNPETPKFVPKRLREAFDELPRALVSPPVHLLGFARESFSGPSAPLADANANANATRATGFMSVHPSVAASVAVPAAYLGPDGALVPRVFFRVAQDGAREGPTAFEDAAQWKFASRAVRKWARALAVEERRQALDIRRYDMHDAVFVFAGRTPRARPGQHYDTYALDVPGLLEGYPPVAPLDALKLRITKAGGGGDEASLGSRFFGSVASGEAPRRGERFEASNFDFHVEDERCVVHRGGGRGKRPGGWTGVYGVEDAAALDGAKNKSKNMNDAVLDAGLPLDVGAEVCVTVFRVVPRKALVIVAFPPCVSRNARGDPRIAIRAHVRFAHDVNAFKAQRAALLAAQASPATLAMLQDESPTRSETSSSSRRDEAEATGPSRAPPLGDANALGENPEASLEANLDYTDFFVPTSVGGVGGVGDAGAPFPFSRRVVSALRERLNDEQWRVVRDVCAGRAAIASDSEGTPFGPPYCAFGPPGTGKTVTVVAAVVAVLATQPDARVLVCAPAPFAADVACARLADLTERMRSDAVNDGSDASPPALGPVTAGGDEQGDSFAFRRDGWTMVRVNDPRRDPASVKSEVSRFCAALGSEGAAALKARVVVCSCASAGFLADLLSATPLVFTHVFVDEAGQATVPETLVPLRMTSATRTRALVLAGDPKQLGPVVHAASARALRESLLVSAVEAHERDAREGARRSTPECSRLVKLTRNYRSHQDIFGLSSRLFYDDALVAAAPPANVSLPTSLVGAAEDERLATLAGTEVTSNPELEPEPTGRPARMLFVGVRGVQTREGTGEAPSFFNAMEARMLVDVLAAWLKDSEREDDDTAPARYPDASADGALRLRTCDVGVIAPYRAQVVRLRTLLRARRLGAVRVGTVDDYQGQEEKVMFISTVASRGPPTKPKGADSGDATSGDVSSDPRLGFLACPRRFNVAVTRAKALNVIVGHPVALERWTHWKALLRHCLARGAYVGEGELAADLGARGRSFLPRAPSSRDEDSGLGIEASPSLADPSRLEDDGEKPDEDDGDEYEALASAISRVAETSLLGGGDADEMFPDFEVGTSFGEHQSWRVAL